MDIRGGQPASIYSQFQTFLNSVQGGGRYFSKMSELSEGGGGRGKPNWEFVPNFPVFLVTPTLRHTCFCILGYDFVWKSEKYNNVPVSS